MIATQFDAKIHKLRSDNRGEYISRNMDFYFDESGIVHQTTCPCTPKFDYTKLDPSKSKRIQVLSPLF